MSDASIQQIEIGVKSEKKPTKKLRFKIASKIFKITNSILQLGKNNSFIFTMFTGIKKCGFYQVLLFLFPLPL